MDYDELKRLHLRQGLELRIAKRENEKLKEEIVLLYEKNDDLAGEIEQLRRQLRCLDGRYGNSGN